MIRVTYLYHSGYMVETEKNRLIFDYYTEQEAFDLLRPQQWDDKPVYVFVSHFHGDHYDKRIFRWRETGKNIRYIISDDVRLSRPYAGTDVTFVHAGEQYQVENVAVKTLQSTDEGVAFLVNIDGLTIYHAGDLNWWHWNGETEAYNAEMGKLYRQEVDKLAGIPIDIAFVPMDPRLEDKYILGMEYVLNHLDVKRVFPMHFWQDYSAFERLEQDGRTESYRDRIPKIQAPGQVFEWTE